MRHRRVGRMGLETSLPPAFVVAGYWTWSGPAWDCRTGDYPGEVARRSAYALDLDPLADPGPTGRRPSGPAFRHVQHLSGRAIGTRRE